ncbi:hypothetical protein ACFOOP_04290 [Marinicaulis aureus]|uniref:PEP-CTERM sorting domain-containing protein n=1 Tax=Hyphococcus aureus TaxID=2666033 RepID=A0ABW1KUP8_9PROT
MNGRLKKRGILALIIYFLMITAVSTPIAFMTGKARGADRAGLNSGARDSLLQNGTGADAIEAPISLAMAPQDGSPGNDIQAAPERPNANAAFGPRTPSAKPAALREAVLRAISSGPSGVSDGSATGEDQAPSPFSLAMAPGLSPGGGVMQGGAVNKPGGYPGAIIPGAFPPVTNTPPGEPGSPVSPPTTNGPDGPTPGIDEPPVLVTPIPGALPFMLTGLAALFAAGKRARI